MIILDKETRKQLAIKYTEAKIAAKQKAQLLSNKTDWAALELFIQRCNEDPKLCVDIKLNDGTVISLHTKPADKKYTDNINGDY